MGSSEPTESTPDGDDGHRTPRWVKGFIIAAIVAFALVAIALAAGGDHGPARHLPDGGEGTVQTPEGHTPPLDHG